MGGKAAATTEEQEQLQSRQDVLRRLHIACGLCLTFLLVEVVGGYLSGSLAVLSDAAHLLSDLAAFLVAIGASHLAALPASDQHTFGLKRMESLAALLSMVSLALVSVGLAYEALRRMYVMMMSDREGEEAHPVDGTLMSGIAGIGVAVNVALAFVLGPENHVHMPGSHAHDHSHDHGHHDDDDDDHGHDHDHHHATTTTCSSSGSTSHDHSHSHAQHAASTSSDGGGEDHHDHSHSHAAAHGADSHDHAIADEHTSLLLQHHHPDEIDPLEMDVEDQHQHHHQHSTRKKTKKNVNLHAAYLHVLGDLLQSVAVLLAGLVIWIKPSWHLVDPIITLLFCAIVFYSTLHVIRSSVAVLLEEVPPNISWQDVYTALSSLDSICNVHDLHIWSISDGVPSLSMHCLLASGNNDEAPPDPQQALRDVHAVCERFGIRHSTIQIQCGTGEEDEGDCITCPIDHACVTNGDS